MPLKVLLLSLALALTGCVGPTVVPREITCPTEPPPTIPELPKRPDPPDLRSLEPDRYRIEGLWEGIKTRQSAYRESWDECPKAANPVVAAP